MPLRGRGTRRRDSARGAPRDRERLLVHVDRRGAAPLRRMLDPRRFAELHHNPTALLYELTDEDLARALTPDYLERLGAGAGAADSRPRRGDVVARAGTSPPTSSSPTSPPSSGSTRACPIYSGGLGVLAGDYLKAASELGIPLVGIGLFYRRGYFQPAARRARPPDRALPADAHDPAAARARADGAGRRARGRRRRSSCRCGSACGGRPSGASPCTSSTRIVEGNPDWAITDTLYGGDRANRLRQEVLLGVGGVRVLRGLGLEPTVFHLNEGHSAFLQLERMRELVEEQGLSTDAAVERLRASTVFTTHTPVPAGNEVFDPELVQANARRHRRALRARVGGFRRARQGRAERQGLRAHAVRAPHVAVRERRLRAARRRLARDVARALARDARRRGSDHVGHERRPPANVDLRRARGAARRHGSAVRASARARGRTICGRRTAARRNGCSGSSSTAAARASSTPTSSRSASPGASRRTSARASSSAGPSGSRSFSPIPSGRSRCSSPARHTRPTRTARI